MHYSTCFADSDVHFFILRPVTLECDPKIFELLHQLQFQSAPCSYRILKQTQAERFRLQKTLLNTSKQINLMLYKRQQLFQSYIKLLTNNYIIRKHQTRVSCSCFATITLLKKNLQLWSPTATFQLFTFTQTRNRRQTKLRG